MAVSTEQKTVNPDISLAHEEKIEVVETSQVNGSSYDNIQDYESRSIDLRTILGLLVVLSSLLDPSFG